jgi:hypothetical protein
MLSWWPFVLGRSEESTGASEASGPPSDGYRSWEQIAGYFDGDGNVGIEVVLRVLRIRLRFVDTWQPQIDSIWRFMKDRGISTSNVGRDDKGAWQAAYRLDITAVRSVLAAAKAMFPHVVKKQEDLRIAIQYLEGRITGNEAVAFFNAEVRLGRRKGKIREAYLPATREEGLRQAKIENATRARASYAVNVSPELQARIRSDHTRAKLGHIGLSKKYGYSVSVIRRILGER